MESAHAHDPRFAWFSLASLGHRGRSGRSPLLAWALAFLVLFTFGSSSRAAEGDPQPAFQKHTLPNGLEVLFHVDRSVPLVAVDVYYHVGSGAEEPGKSGFAHLFEHLMFQGTEHTGPDQHLRLLRDLGASDINGTTNPNRTDYYQLVPSNALETALWLESERMGYLAPTLDQQSLDIQRAVVRNERRQVFDNVPYGREYLAVNEALYPKGHPYRYQTVGLHKELEAATLEDVQAFFRRWYVPSNATLCLAGDFDPDQALKLVQKWFGGFPASTKPKPLQIQPPEIQGPRRFEIHDPFARQRRLHLAWHSPALFAKGDAELDVLGYALGQPGIGRLWRRLVLDRGWATEVKAYQVSHQMSSIFHIVADLTETADLQAVQDAIDEELARVASTPLTDREIRQAVASIETAVTWGLERLLARAEVLQHYNHHLGHPNFLGWDLDRFRAVRPEHVQAIVSQFLQTARRAEIVTLPGAGPNSEIEPPSPPIVREPLPLPDALVFPDDEFRRQSPALGSPPPFHPPTFQNFRLDNGIEVFLMERPALPTVSMELLFETGSIADPVGKEGLSHLCMGLLDDGPTGMDSPEFQSLQADIGTTIEAYSSPEQQGLRVASLKKHLDASLHLWSAALLRPALRPEELQRAIEHELARLDQSKAAASPLAMRLFGPVFYGPDHPLGRLMTSSSLRAVTLQDCQNFVRESLLPEGARLYAVGAVSKKELEEKLGTRLSGWKGKPRPAPAVPAPQPMQGRIFFVDVPDAEQSQIFLGHTGPARNTPDYFPTRLMLGILGGGFTSRINMNLREKHGYTYGADGYVFYTRNTGILLTNAPVHSEATKLAVLELLKEIRELAEGPITEAELAREKDAAVLSLSGRFEIGIRALESLRDLVYFGLPLNYYEGYSTAIRSVTAEEVQQAARNHLHPEALQVLIAGDAKTVLPGLKELIQTKALGEGDLVLLDSDGHPTAPKPP